MMIPCPEDHPRIRGEHAVVCVPRQAGKGSSPHTRGAHRLGRPPSQNHRIIPAYAGSTSGCSATSTTTTDHPRIRGEHCQMPLALLPWTGSSPHTRGAPVVDPRGQAGLRIIPAYAGSTFSRRRWTSVRRGSSPHTRGARLRQTSTPGPERIIPAYAGSTASSHFAERTCWDHPRIRGEHNPIKPPIGDDMGSSPHTRGAPAEPAAVALGRGIIPAYAGSTSGAHRDGSPVRDHPRIRGEHTEYWCLGYAKYGSSPHTRGARRCHYVGPPADRIIPAYAGSTGSTSSAGVSPKDHPRIRGEHATNLKPTSTKRGSSPHTRGAREGCESNVAGRGIIPAYAGSTTSIPNP